MTPQQRSNLVKYINTVRDDETLFMLIAALEQRIAENKGTPHQVIEQSKRDRKAFLDKRRHMIKRIREAEPTDNMQQLLQSTIDRQRWLSLEGYSYEYKY